MRYETRPDRPPRIAVISDIHANLPALQAVLQRIEELKVDQVYCLGDIVGYGGHPNECVTILREKKVPCVLGNHDQAALGELDITNFNAVAKQAIRWTQNELSKENQDFLRSRPMEISLEDVFLVHASPRNPEEWNYILSIPDAHLNFEHFKERICCIGHSHQPFIIENRDGKLMCPEEPQIEIQEQYRYLVNVGSVGQPRDHNPESCFALYDRNTKRLELVRVPYDIDAAQSRILEQGLPEVLATRLTYGS